MNVVVRDTNVVFFPLNVVVYVVVAVREFFATEIFLCSEGRQQKLAFPNKNQNM